ncbi:pullulanase X25 domain-containing protein [Arthrobacter oryzae]|uniref:pullulanase X25 domain-containing protein n=1 Tax=Arthrobacter oryzae TaxID=409290 RepID=UPI00273BA86C|nr:glycosidase [Arthrobacter oryzae]WLQ04988.1 glycosidase [Arthrobacter oryzae]
MPTAIADTTTVRLKSVLDILAESVLSGETLGAGAVLAQATVRVPLNEKESELLSGGIPRGHKALTTATSKLVKAGWLVKGRSGWTITEDGLRATVAFPDADSFATALAEGTPVPSDVPVPTELPARAAAPKAAAAKAPKAAPKKKAPSKAAKVVEKAAELIEEAVAPVAKAVRTRKAAAKPATAGEEAAEAQAVAQGAESIDQPEAVAIAGDFNVLLGAPANWAPQYDESQMKLDAVDKLWKLTTDLPAGHYSFKIALNRSWDENYGAFGAFDGANHELHHPGGRITFNYDHRTRDITLV